MSADGDFRRIAIVGIGLIGGSVAFAVRRACPDAVLVGIDRDDVVGAARQLGAIHHGASDLSAAVGADLVLLAAPVRQNLAALARLSTLLTAPAVVTDAGSTKREMLEAARDLPPHIAFVGGHPLAGAERGGIEASRPDLFERRSWILTPAPASAREAVDRVSAFVRALGASPVEMGPDTHDHLLAFTSHLPQLTASALMHVVGEAVGEPGLDFAGRGLADTTRVAASPPAIWRDICVTNTDEILPALDRLIGTLADIRAELAAGRPPDRVFESAARWRRRLR